MSRLSIGNTIASGRRVEELEGFDADLSWAFAFVLDVAASGDIGVADETGDVGEVEVPG